MIIKLIYWQKGTCFQHYTLWLKYIITTYLFRLKKNTGRLHMCFYNQFSRKYICYTFCRRISVSTATFKVQSCTCIMMLKQYSKKYNSISAVGIVLPYLNQQFFCVCWIYSHFFYFRQTFMIDSEVMSGLLVQCKKRNLHNCISMLYTYKIGNVIGHIRIEHLPW